MNFLSGSCLARYGQIWFWAKECSHRDLWKTINVLNMDIKRKPRVCKSIFYQRGLNNNLCVSSAQGNLINWTQVRFNKDYPRLHRDLNFPNFDAYRKDEFKDVRKTDWGLGDEKPGFTYVVGFFGLLATAYGLKTELVHFISFMAPAADVLALASIEVDITNIAPGGCATYKWRGKPLFIKNRTSADIDLEAKTEVSTLRDPQSVEDRTVKPEWLVVIGICTHLGCVPIPNSGDWSGGFYCPCHGSHYDNAGRIRKGPAPLNLEVPPYKFVSDNLILIG